jgi:deoxyribose-phosphate aldolase
VRDLRRVAGDWVKTSTGYGTSGATLDDLRLMRRYAPAHVQVKAAGGVRDLDMALAVRDVGVTRFGCTRTVEILEECQRRLATHQPITGASNRQVDHWIIGRKMCGKI